MKAKLAILYFDSVYQSDFIIQGGTQTMTKIVKNKKVSKPWYKRFWVWLPIVVIAISVFEGLTDKDGNKKTTYYDGILDTGH